MPNPDPRYALSNKTRANYNAFKAKPHPNSIYAAVRAKGSFYDANQSKYKSKHANKSKGGRVKSRQYKKRRTHKRR